MKNSTQTVKLLTSILTISLALIMCQLSYANNLNSCNNLVDETLCSKIGRLLIVGFGGIRQDTHGYIVYDDVNGIKFDYSSLIAHDIADNRIGGVIFFLNPIRDRISKQFIRDRNIQSPQQFALLTHDILLFYQQTQPENNSLPLLMALDEEGGMIERLPVPQGFYPKRNLIPQALGAAEEMGRYNIIDRHKALQASYQQALSIGKTLAKYHINVDFAPVVDVNINPLNPIIGGLGRSFSSKAGIVTDQAVVFINGLHEYGITTTLKHFPGHGSSSGDSHLGLVDVTKTYQRNRELYPYKKLINAGYNDLIMTTHVINGQLDRSQCLTGNPNDPATWCPGTLSKKSINLLRNTLHFNGVIVSDDMTMGAISKVYPLATSLQKTLNAGVDMLIIANNDNHYTDTVIRTIAQLVHDGKVSRKTIEDAYNRTVDLKQRIQYKRLKRLAR